MPRNRRAVRGAQRAAADAPARDHAGGASVPNPACDGAQPGGAAGEAPLPPRHDGRVSPGDAFNKAGPEWDELLLPHGWELMWRRGRRAAWRRPGKTADGLSATTGVCSNEHSGELFACFSSNAPPFEGPTSGRICSVHSKFAVYTLLNHGGDFSAAAKALYDRGFGDRGEHVGVPGGARQRRLPAPNSTVLR